MKTAANLVFLDGLQHSTYSREQGIALGATTGTHAESHAIPRSVPEGAISDVDFSDDEDLSSPPVHHRAHSTGDMDIPMRESYGSQQVSSARYQGSAASMGLTHPYGSPSSTWHYSPTSPWATSPNNDAANPKNVRPSANEVLNEHLNQTLQVDILEANASRINYTTDMMSPEPLSGMYVDSSIFPIANKEEAALFRYYVKRLARDFDMSDPQSHFRTVVPQRAATCPLLLNAIYALSARHLSRISNYDPFAADKYHQECLKRVIPILNDSAAVLDENLLASAIILRHLEEFEVPLSGFSPSDRQSHLLGSHAFIKAQRHPVEYDGLRQAAFWVGLGQGIYVAIVNQRSIVIALDDLNIDRSCEPAADHRWSCRMVALCADVIRYCFGEDDRSVNTFQRLSESVEDWNKHKNESFTPIYFKDTDEGNVFPEIWFRQDEVIVGWQHYYLAKILLSAHDPKVPRLGPSRNSVLRAVDEDIKGYVRLLCGIAISNPDLAPNFT